MRERVRFREMNQNKKRERMREKGKDEENRQVGGTRKERGICLDVALGRAI